MIQRISKRFLSLLLVAVMVLALVPAITLPAFAATSGTVTGLADENIGLSFTGDADNAWSASGTQIVGSARSKSGSCSNTNYRSTLTITNKKTTKATLSFDYTVVVSEGTILVDNATTTANGSFSKELAAGGTVEVEITSGSASADTKITMTNVKLVAAVSATVTFQPAENGSYTVDGRNITEVYTHTQSSMTAYQVAATPAEGYRFKGWYDVASGKCISTDAKTALNFDSDRTITARFVSKELALFETGGQVFDDLNEAVTYAQENGQSKITLATDGSISGTYTIPAGITLLIPFDEAKTCYTSTPAATTSQAGAKVFRTLTMAAGSSLTLASGAAISVGGQYYAASGSTPGKMVGPYGYIKMESGSAITVQSGASLYAWGFISGSGSVTVQPGGSVYEWYQVLDFRGGTATSHMGNEVFPFSQYAVQNVEVPLTLHAGASEKVYTAVYAMRKINPTSIPFIGNDGMFKIVSGSLTKAYDGATDRIHYTIDGVAEVNSLNLKLAGASVSSSSYVLPLTNNMTINLVTGSKLTINQTAALLPGVETTIAKDAELVVSSGKSIYIYDHDEWVAQNFVTGGKFKAVPYAPGKHYNRTEADLIDVKVDVNGTLIANGGIYTTKGGADICSSNGTGVYNQQGRPGTETTTYQYTQINSDVTAHEIPITPAKLHNADGTYYETKDAKAGDTIHYVSGVWGGAAPVELTVTFDKNGSAEYPVEGEMPSQTVNAKTDTALNANTFTREGYSFTGWNTAADGTGDSYADGATVNLTENTTLYAQWTQDPVITFDANGGEGTMGTQTVKPNGATALTANTFTRADYDFAGWNTEADGTGKDYADGDAITTSENVTLYAQWTLHKYHVRWLNWDGSVLQEGDYTIKDTVSYDGGIPERPEDDDCTYKFKGWDPFDGDAPTDIHKDTDYTAQFNKLKKLTVTFDANGGSGTMEPVKIANGASGRRYTLPECTFTREGYDFAGWLITGTVSDGFDDEPYRVEDEQWGDTWLYAFSDLTLKASWKMLENGWYAENGNYYYRLNGKPATGMVRVPYPAAALLPGYGPDAEDAEVNVPGKEGNPDNYDYPDRESALFVFDENGVFQKNQCGVYDDNGVTRWINNGMLVWHAGLVKDGDDYRYFKRNGMVTSVETYVAKTNGLLKAAKYTFDAEGRLMKLEGLHEDLNGKLCYYVDYVKNYAGLVEVNGSFYYIASDLKAVKNCTYYVTKTNDLKPAGYYTFDADGKMVIKSGLVEENGDLYYYVDGAKTTAGLIKWDGNYYYIASNLKAVKDAKHYVFADKANGLKSAGWYWFNADGTMYLEGIREENGTKYYYKDGVKNYAGLIEISGEYYYVKSDCSVVCGRSYYVTKSNGLMPSATYTFDADGKMVIKNGIYREKLGDGNEYLFYYVNNVRQVNTGLVQLDDGSYIYVRSGANLAVGSYYVSKTNDLLPKGTYTFGEDGKMVVNP